MTVTCRGCGETWPHDPAWLVPCPVCLAPVGSPCKRPSGHGCALHMARDQAALDAGVLGKCAAGPSAAQPLLPLFDHRPGF